ncbi:hypothetical protein [Ornithobacterium rhinotracheale]|uniref:hypothetical protein n=1 Tax=Ornithobacterium rhinotracheale TaxID=28251 RepID=UPI002158B317|nr:hypothetical protein [Ornithobacterium rhinotracheale]UVD87902.1 hypothetical protein NV236_03370 [Ornithobacterium rhinotracheale]
MKKSILLLSVLAMGASLYAQDQGRVGINTTKPKATLDISKEGVDDAKGLLIPRLTADEVKTMTDANKVGLDQNSLLLYVTQPFADTKNKTGKYELIDQAGYYYYDAKDNGGKWKKLDTTLYGSNGTLSANRTVTMDGKTLTFSGTNVQIKVPNMQERPATENVSGVVMSADGTLKKDTGWWRLGDGDVDATRITNQSRLIYQMGTIDIYGTKANITGRFYSESPELGPLRIREENSDVETKLTVNQIEIEFDAAQLERLKRDVNRFFKANEFDLWKNSTYEIPVSNILRWTSHIGPSVGFGGGYNNTGWDSKLIPQLNENSKIYIYLGQLIAIKY